MTNKLVKLTGAQVKDLLTRAVGGIYVSRYFDVMTDFYKKYAVTDNGLEIAVNDMLTAKIPIQSEAEYINFAIGCDISESMDSEDTVYEEWKSSTYFEYKFEIANLMICFNVTEKDYGLTWEQFRELVTHTSHTKIRHTTRNYATLGIWKRFFQFSGSLLIKRDTSSAIWHSDAL